MKHQAVLRFVLALGLATVGIPPAATLRADSWIVKSVAPGLTSAANVDVMALPCGDVVLGYATVATPGPGGSVVLARLPSGQETFVSRTDTGAGDAASFAIDQSGNVFYATRDPQNAGIRIGQDFGPFGGPMSSLLPASGSNATSAMPAAVPTVAVNALGLPVVADMSRSGTRFLSTFNVTQGTWQSASLSALGSDTPSSPAGSNCLSLTFDAADNPVLSYVQQNDGAAGTLVVGRIGVSGWENVDSTPALAAFGTSVSAAPGGSIGFAYVNATGALCFNTFGSVLGAPQVVSVQTACLTSHSLAYDAGGNPAIVYSTGGTANTLHLARRNSLGDWNDQLLPVTAVSGEGASLTFDAAGQPLIAAITSSGLDLLGQDLVVHWSGTSSQTTWSTAGNWSGGVPNAVGANATITARNNSPLTVTLDAPQTVGTLVLNSGTSGGCTLLGGSGNALTLSNSGSAATIVAGGGSETINAPVVLASDLVVSGTGTLTFGNSSSIAGSCSLTMSGGGTLILSGTNTYSGGTAVDAGTLIVASAAALGDGTSLQVGGAGAFAPTAQVLHALMAPSAIVQASPVPEPEALSLLAGAVLFFAAANRLRRETQAACSTLSLLAASPRRLGFDSAPQNDLTNRSMAASASRMSPTPEVYFRLRSNK